MPVACAIDVGILPNGEAALIEVNDAFSLGLYENVCLEVNAINGPSLYKRVRCWPNEEKLSEYDEHYCKCLIERWNELKGV